MTAAEMAHEVSLSPTAATRRVQRLEKAGVITGYSAQLDYAKLGYAIEAFIEVRFIGKTRPQAMDETAVRLPEVVAVFTTAGNYDALVWIRVQSIDHLRDVVDALRVSPGVADTRTHIVLASHFVRGPLDAPGEEHS